MSTDQEKESQLDIQLSEIPQMLDQSGLTPEQIKEAFWLFHLMQRTKHSPALEEHKEKRLSMLWARLDALVKKNV